MFADDVCFHHISTKIGNILSLSVCVLPNPLNEMWRRRSGNSFIFVLRNFQDTSLNLGILCGPTRVTGQVSCLSLSWAKSEQIHETVASALAVTEDQKFWKISSSLKEPQMPCHFSHRHVALWCTSHMAKFFLIFSSLPSWKMSLNSNKMNPHHSLFINKQMGKIDSGVPS